MQIQMCLDQKNPRAHKNKIGTSPPPPPKNPNTPPPPKARNFMGMGLSCRKNAFSGAHKIGAASSGPRAAGKTIYGHEDFSDWSSLRVLVGLGCFVSVWGGGGSLLFFLFGRHLAVTGLSSIDICSVMLCVAHDEEPPPTPNRRDDFLRYCFLLLEDTTILTETSTSEKIKIPGFRIFSLLDGKRKRKKISGI